MDPLNVGLWRRLKSNHFASTVVILATLALGILDRHCRVAWS